MGLRARRKGEWFGCVGRQCLVEGLANLRLSKSTHINTGDGDTSVGTAVKLRGVDCDGRHEKQQDAEQRNKCDRGDLRD
jgi:hypothetical protein